ncbi:helix-turn-helix domain-containing protein [Larkinella punicea]|uniref:Helix-turn-helix domain-containing protein n=1 Tax=Larkinella punicea TaxID=2315727 RepID=A0A368JJR0_9BACT|nr:helix-turn-helix domain-containing protein [Larkinella punicea]RCR67899.1 helix-turn-helix domain-containing protein [Larkinella punicea]
MVGSDDLFLPKLISLIDSNLINPSFSAEIICREMGVSRSGLHRLVKEHTGLSVTLFIRRYRLEKAKILLKTTELRSVEIAELVGIPNPQNFSKYFTEAYAVSPSEYRKLPPETDHFIPDPEPIVADTMPIIAEPKPIRQQPVSPPVTDSRRRYRYLIPGLLVAGLALLVWLRFGRQTDDLQTSSGFDSSIAILPFRNLGTAETQYFSEGVREQVQVALAYIPQVKVISRTSTQSYEKTAKTVPQIARELDVSYLLEGSALQLGNRIKLSVALIRAEENQTVWTKTYEGETKDLWAFTSTVAKTIAGELNQQLSSIIRKKMDKAPTLNPTAMTEYLKGEYFLRTRTKEGLNNSLINLNRAIALDSGFAEAYASKAQVYFLYFEEGYADADSSMKRAEQNALTAIRLDSENANAFALLAKLYQRQSKWEQALTTIRIALQYQPNNALTNYWYSLMLRSVGEADRAIEYSTKALRIDPLFPVIMIGHLGNLTYAGRFEEARQVMEEGQRLHASAYGWYWSTAFYYINQNRWPEALRELEKAQRLNPDTRSFPVFIAYVKARMHQPAAARALLDSLPDDVTHYPYRSVLYIGLGDTDRCLTYLEKGAEVGSLPDYLKVSPVFKSLRNTPRFQAVIRKVGLDKTAF